MNLDTRVGKTAQRLIAMAVSLCGDAQPVRKAMRCSEEDFTAYCAGRKEPPWPEMDGLITLIVHEQGSIIAKNRELLKSLKDRR